MEIVGWISDSASTFVVGGLVDALRLSTLRMSKAEGLSNLFGSNLPCH
jgi:hypothetical protein